jgi:hypothetical protein
MTKAPAQPEKFPEEGSARSRFLSPRSHLFTVFPSYFIPFSLFHRASRHPVRCSKFDATILSPPNLSSFHLRQRVA